MQVEVAMAHQMAQGERLVLGVLEEAVTVHQVLAMEIMAQLI
jgi:hypothetical protein